MLVLPVLLSGCNSTSDLYYKFDYDLSDYITLGQYKGLPVTSSSIEVTREDLDMQIQVILAQKGESENIPEDQALESGDTVICRCIVTLDGEEIPELYEESSTFILGIAHYGEDIDNALIGTKQGDKVTAKRTLDEMYGEYAGKTVDYEMYVLGGYNIVQPSYTDAFVKAFYGFPTIEEFEKDLANRMYEFRKAMNIQQAELAEMVGVRRETIGKLENGKYNPSLKLAMDIAKVFGRSVEEIFIFEDDEEIDKK
jgi:putative transcriptional regulator